MSIIHVQNMVRTSANTIPSEPTKRFRSTSDIPVAYAPIRFVRLRYPRCSAATLRRWSDQGLIPFRKSPGGTRFYHMPTLDTIFCGGDGSFRVRPSTTSSETTSETISNPSASIVPNDNTNKQEAEPVRKESIAYNWRILKTNGTIVCYKNKQAISSI